MRVGERPLLAEVALEYGRSWQGKLAARRDAVPQPDAILSWPKTYPQQKDFTLEDRTTTGGTVGDFRDDLGRYVICEFKDWTNKKVDFSTIAKFCRVLESAKCKTGILFSKDGISGAGKNKYAARERLKVFQDKGLAILCLELRDIEKLKRGLNFVSLLREKYESVRLDTIENIDAIERNISNSGE